MKQMAKHQERRQRIYNKLMKQSPFKHETKTTKLNKAFKGANSIT